MTFAVEISLQLSDEFEEADISRLRDDMRRYLSHMLDAAKIDYGHIKASNVAVAGKSPSEAGGERLLIERIEISRLHRGAREAVDHMRALQTAHHGVGAQTQALMENLREFAATLSSVPDRYPAAPSASQVAQAV